MDYVYSMLLKKHFGLSRFLKSSSVSSVFSVLSPCRRGMQSISWMKLCMEKLDMQIETAHDVTGDLRNIMHVAFLLTSVVFAFRTDVFACRLKCTVLQRFARSFWLSPSTPFSNMPKKQSLKRSASPPVDMPQVVHKPPPERGRSALPEITMNPVLEKAMALHQEGKQEVELANSSALPPGPKYRAGRCVFVWWADWMKDGVTPPATYDKRSRPSWYSGAVHCHYGWQTKHYAGRVFSSNWYFVYLGNKDGENVPEEFILDAGREEDGSALDMVGRLIEHIPPPEFWESFNTSNVNAQSSSSKQEVELANSSALPPGPKYRAGQSVFQWWASWMKDAVTPPEIDNKINRPKWYSREVFCHKEWKTQKYAGKMFTSHFYTVGDCNSHCSDVPEEFLSHSSHIPLLESFNTSPPVSSHGCG
jgi:hypothetical protein